MSLSGSTIHDFVLKDGELFCADISTIRAGDVSIVVDGVELMGRHQGKDYEINLCEGCYETTIRCLMGDLEERNTVLMKCLQHFMNRGNQQGELQDQIKSLVPDWDTHVDPYVEIKVCLVISCPNFGNPVGDGKCCPGDA